MVTLFCSLSWHAVSPVNEDNLRGGLCSADSIPTRTNASTLAFSPILVGGVRPVVVFCLFHLRKIKHRKSENHRNESTLTWSAQDYNLKLLAIMRRHAEGAHTVREAPRTARMIRLGVVIDCGRNMAVRPINCHQVNLSIVLAHRRTRKTSTREVKMEVLIWHIIFP